MGPYHIEMAPAAARQFKKLQRQVQGRVEKKIDSLANDPRPPGVEKLEGGDNFYRVRVGDYRIIYSIADRRLLVLILKIGDRKDVYRFH